MMKLRIGLLLTTLMTPSLCFAQDTERNDTERKDTETRDPSPNQQRPGLLQRPGQRPGQGPRGEQPNPEMMARGMAMMLRNLPIMKALDLDEDGQLSASEVENASKSLMKLDKNGDGVISAEEMRPEPGPFMGSMEGAGQRPGGADGRNAPNPAMMMRMFENRDENKDGKLSGEEIPPQMRERLSMIDENGDGAIDKAEMEKSMRRIEGMRPGNRPGREGSGGQGVVPRRPPVDDKP